MLMEQVLKLILIRHAEAESAGFGEEDASRTLSRRGRQQALALREWLASLKSHQAQRVFHSNAARAMETAQLAFQGEGVPLEAYPGLYLAPRGQLLTTALSTRGELSCLAIVAHNPGLSSLVSELSSSPFSFGCADACVLLLKFVGERGEDGDHIERVSLLDSFRAG